MNPSNEKENSGPGRDFEIGARSFSWGEAGVLQFSPRQSGEDCDSAFTKQIGGEHYKGMKLQPVEFILANKLGFCEGNAIKYICRHGTKGGRQDLEKAIHYIQLLIEDVYGQNSNTG